MPDPTDFEARDSPPPPAYEFCQQEFDQKVSHALEASQSEQRRYDEEEWELWDEEKFTAAAARLNLDGQPENAAGSSSAPQPMVAPPVHAASASPPPSGVSGNGKAKSDAVPDEWRAGAQVQPLRIVKKNMSLPKEKERPSWYAEAQLGGPQPRPTVVLPDRSVEHRPHRASPPPPMSAYPDERSDTPPPMFTPVGPNLDGPAYEGVVMSYTPGDSRPNSPLHSPPPIEAPMPFNAAQNPPLQSRASGRRSLPQPPQANARSYSPSISPNPRPQSHPLSMPARQIPPRTSPRPATTYNLRPTGFTPRVAFDPSMAYSNEKSSLFSNGPTEEPPPAKIDAAALYSSSVASLYSSSIPAAPQRKPASASSSFYSQQASQSTYHVPQVPSATPQGIGGYYPNRNHMRSPAPSVTSMRSSHSQNASGYQQPAYRPATTYQSNGYQPTSYQPTSY